MIEIEVIEKPANEFQPDPPRSEGPDGAFLPIGEVASTARIWVLGAHGGAGEDTVAKLISATPADHTWPVADGPVVSRVLICARTNLSGLEAARSAAIQALRLPVDVVGCVFVADAPGRLPKPLADLRNHVAGAFLKTWYIPWIDAWRYGPITQGRLPRPVNRMVKELTLAKGA